MLKTGDPLSRHHPDTELLTRRKKVDFMLDIEPEPVPDSVINRGHHPDVGVQFLSVGLGEATRDG
jgi:pterin-4a-carbinolamine dehydratase